MSIVPYTHRELVLYAYRWLLKDKGCGFAFKELVSMDGEVPDAIGFQHFSSILVEVKVSRGDFLKDRKKMHRNGQRKGMGTFRLYMCPEGLIKPEELPHNWGLVYVGERPKRQDWYPKLKIVVDPWSRGEFLGFKPGTSSTIWQKERMEHDVDLRAELCMMYTALRRLNLRGHLEDIYDIRTLPTK